MPYVPQPYAPKTPFEVFVVEELRRVHEQSLLALAQLGLEPLHAAPARPRKYMVVLADGTDWNPLALGRPHLAVYDGAAWQPV